MEHDHMNDTQWNLEIKVSNLDRTNKVNCQDI